MQLPEDFAFLCRCDKSLDSASRMRVSSSSASECPKVDVNQEGVLCSVGENVTRVPAGIQTVNVAHFISHSDVGCYTAVGGYYGHSSDV